MKRAFSTVACGDYSYKQIAECAVKNKLSAIEIRLDDNDRVCGMEDGELPAVISLFKSKELYITDIGTSIALTDYDKVQLERAKHCVMLAAALNAKGVRIFLGNFSAYFSEKPFYSYEGIVKTLKELCIFAEKAGVQIWIETHNEFSTGQVLKKLLDDVSSDYLKIIWDIIHPIEMGETPQQTVSYIGANIAHVHIKDGISTHDTNKISYQYTRLGSGSMPIAEVLRLLKQINYDGALSLEWEKPWRPELQNCFKNIDEILSSFNSYMDINEQNLLPVFGSSDWKQFVPSVKAVSKFEKGRYGEGLKISICSKSYGVGKWLCTMPVEKEKTYSFSVCAHTDCSVNDVYVIVTLLDETGEMITREHIRNSSAKNGLIRFSDCLCSQHSGCRLQIELWLKGRHCSVFWTNAALYETDPIKKRPVRIALAYIPPEYEKIHTIDGNKARIFDVLETSTEYEPDIIVLGECMYERSVKTVSLCEAAQKDDGEMCLIIGKMASRFHSYIIYNFHEYENGDYYNTSVLFDRSGQIVGKYRKTHLTVTELELGLTPGEEYPVFETDFGKIGILICFDHYFPKTSYEIVKNGAEIVFVSTAGDSAEKSIARAMDNGVYFAICGLNNENSHGWGAARVISPDGSLLAHADKPVFCEIDLNERVRRHWLSLGEADSEIYGVYKYEAVENVHREN